MARNFKLNLEVDEGYGVRIVDARFVIISSPRGGQYRVDLERDTCSCPKLECSGVAANTQGSPNGCRICSGVRFLKLTE